MLVLQPQTGHSSQRAGSELRRMGNRLVALLVRHVLAKLGVDREVQEQAQNTTDLLIHYPGIVSGNQLCPQSLEAGGHISCGQVDDETDDRFEPRHAEHLGHSIGINAITAEGPQLIGQRKSVAHAPLCCPGNGRGGLTGQHESVRPGNLLEPLGNSLLRHRPELHLLAARKNRRRHAVDLGRGEDEEDVRRRLFEALEQGVECLAREHVDLVDDDHPITVTHRRKPQQLVELTDVVDTAVRGAVELDHIEARAPCHFDARGAHPAGFDGRPLLAVYGLGEQASDGRFADTPQTGEEIGVTEGLAGEGIVQGLHHRFLGNDVGELLRSPRTGQNLIAHGGSVMHLAVVAPFLRQPEPEPVTVTVTEIFS